MKRVAVVVSGLPVLPALGEGASDGESPSGAGEELTPVLNSLLARGGLLTAPWPSGLSGVLQLFGIVEFDEAVGTLLAAEAYEVPYQDSEALFRCEFLTMAESRVIDRLDQSVSDQEARLLIDSLNEAFAREGVRFHVGRHHRHFLTVGREFVDRTSHDGRGGRRKAGAVTAAGARNPLDSHVVNHVDALLDRVDEALRGHEVNVVRLDLRENPVNAVACLSGIRPADVSVSVPVRFDRVMTTADEVAGLARQKGWQSTMLPSAADMTALFEQTVSRLHQALQASSGPNILVHLDVSSADCSTPRQRTFLLQQLDRVLFAPVRDELQVTASHLAVLLLGNRWGREGERPEPFCRAIVSALNAVSPRPAPTRIDEVLQWLAQ